ncbi:MAG: HEAT repeat domain-containing protein [Planctomycetes bacterium]|nr:HEAT repeat domain-containing protein [Planctomycetota bacterium]
MSDAGVRPGPESNLCPHCGVPVRTGMVRCRDCNGMLADTADEFVLSSRVSLRGPACGKCGSPLTAVNDLCPKCESAALDSLFQSSQRVQDLARREITVAPVTTESHAGIAAAPQRPTVRKARKVSRSKSGSLTTSPACAALLSSLKTADVKLRIDIAVALGKLGDRDAILPLERHMTDADVRVRQAVAAALIQLGHAKGKALLEIAERTPAAQALARGAASSVSPRKPTNGGADVARLKKIGVGFLAASLLVALLGYVLLPGHSSANRARRSKRKSKATAAVFVQPAGRSESASV